MLNTQAPGASTAPASGSAGVAPSFKTNVNRQKTKRWVEAKSFSYDGDDWAEVDDFDEYGAQDHGAAAPQPYQQIGPRQPGQGPAAPGAFAATQSGGPPQFSQQAPQQALLHASQYPPQQPAQPSRTPPSRLAERHAMQPMPPGVHPATLAPVNTLAHPPRHSPNSSVSAAGPFPGPQNRTPSPADSASSNRSAPGAQQPTPRGASLGQDRQVRHDTFPPMGTPPQPHPRASPGPSPYDRPTLDHPPPRKSSLGAGDPTVPTRERTGSNPGVKPLPFIRPSDIYKRINEERDRERKSMDSGRPSVDSSAGSAPGESDQAASATAAAASPRPGQSLETPPRAAGRSPGADAAPRRKDERAGPGTPVQASPRAFGPSTPGTGEVRPATPLKDTPPSARFGPAAKISQGSPSLPSVETFSGFGEPLFPIDTSAPPAADLTPKFASAPARSPAPASVLQGPPLQHQASDGFRSAVNQAFDDRSVPVTPASTLGSQRSQADFSSRSDTASTSGISPIMQRAPSLPSGPPPPIAEESPVEGSATPVKPSAPSLPTPSRTAAAPPPLETSLETLPAQAFKPGYRRDMNAPSPQNSPRRGPRLEVKQPLSAAKVGEVATTTPTGDFIPVTLAYDHRDSPFPPRGDSRREPPRSVAAGGAPVALNATVAGKGPPPDRAAPTGSLSPPLPPAQAGPPSAVVAGAGASREPDSTNFRPSLPGGWVSYATTATDGSMTPPASTNDRTARGNAPAIGEKGTGDAIPTPIDARPDLQHRPLSSGSSAPPTPPPKDTPDDTPKDTPLEEKLPTPGSGFFAPPVPLKARNHPGLTINPNPPATRPPIRPALSTDPSPHDQESDRLRKEIVKSLSPIESQFGHEDLGLPADANELTWNAAQEAMAPSRLDAALNAAAAASYLPPAAVDTMAPLPTAAPAPVAQSPAEPRPSMLKKRFSWEQSAESVSTLATIDAAGSKVEDASAPTPVSAVPHPERQSGQDVPLAFAIDEGLAPPVASAPSATEPGTGLELAPQPVEPASMTAPGRVPDSSVLGEAPSLAEKEVAAAIEPRASPVVEPVGAEGALRQASSPSTSSFPGTSQIRAPTFREILALKTPTERIQAFKSARDQFALGETGLSQWITLTTPVHSEHLHLLGAPTGRPTATTKAAAGASGHAPSLSGSGLAKSSSTSGQAAPQPYYQQYLNFSSSPNSNAPAGGAGTPGTGMPLEAGQTFSPTGTSSKFTSHQVQAKGKDLLHSAGIFGGKANVAAKGLFAKGKSKLRGASGEKGLPETTTREDRAVADDAPAATVRRGDGRDDSLEELPSSSHERDVSPDRAPAETAAPGRHVLQMLGPSLSVSQLADDPPPLSPVSALNEHDLATPGPGHRRMGSLLSQEDSSVETPNPESLHGPVTPDLQPQATISGPFPDYFPPAPGDEVADEEVEDVIPHEAGVGGDDGSSATLDAAPRPLNLPGKLPRKKQGRDDLGRAYGGTTAMDDGTEATSLDPPSVPSPDLDRLIKLIEPDLGPVGESPDATGTSRMLPPVVEASDPTNDHVSALDPTHPSAPEREGGCAGEADTGEPDAGRFVPTMDLEAKPDANVDDAVQTDRTDPMGMGGVDEGPQIGTRRSLATDMLPAIEESSSEDVVPVPEEPSQGASVEYTPFNLASIEESPSISSDEAVATPPPAAQSEEAMKGMLPEISPLPRAEHSVVRGDREERPGRSPTVTSTRVDPFHDVSPERRDRLPVSPDVSPERTEKTPSAKPVRITLPEDPPSEACADQDDLDTPRRSSLYGSQSPITPPAGSSPQPSSIHSSVLSWPLSRRFQEPIRDEPATPPAEFTRHPALRTFSGGPITQIPAKPGVLVSETSVADGPETPREEEAEPPRDPMAGLSTARRSTGLFKNRGRNGSPSKRLSYPLGARSQSQGSPGPERRLSMSTLDSLDQRERQKRSSLGGRSPQLESGVVGSPASPPLPGSSQPTPPQPDVPAPVVPPERSRTLDATNYPPTGDAPATHAPIKGKLESRKLQKQHHSGVEGQEHGTVKKRRFSALGGLFHWNRSSKAADSRLSTQALPKDIASVPGIPEQTSADQALSPAPASGRGPTAHDPATRPPSSGYTTSPAQYFSPDSFRPGPEQGQPQLPAQGQRQPPPAPAVPPPQHEEPPPQRPGRLNTAPQEPLYDRPPIPAPYQSVAGGRAYWPSPWPQNVRYDVPPRPHPFLPPRSESSRSGPLLPVRSGHFGPAPNATFLDPHAQRDQRASYGAERAPPQVQSDFRGRDRRSSPMPFARSHGAPAPWNPSIPEHGPDQRSHSLSPSPSPSQPSANSSTIRPDRARPSQSAQWTEQQRQRPSRRQSSPDAWGPSPTISATPATSHSLPPGVAGGGTGEGAPSSRNNASDVHRPSMLIYKPLPPPPVPSKSPEHTHPFMPPSPQLQADVHDGSYQRTRLPSAVTPPSPALTPRPISDGDVGREAEHRVDERMEPSYVPPDGPGAMPAAEPRTEQGEPGGQGEPVREHQYSTSVYRPPSPPPLPFIPLDMSKVGGGDAANIDDDARGPQKASVMKASKPQAASQETEQLAGAESKADVAPLTITTSTAPEQRGQQEQEQEREEKEVVDASATKREIHELHGGEDEDDEIIMSPTAYPGQTWQPSSLSMMAGWD
ncbi:MAG: hypothetical protein M1838_001189 [Thelocarpon superellum]|nr:MAG: hypothetical protein M1838_001189 [Thelocarpon superellum]